MKVNAKSLLTCGSFAESSPALAWVEYCNSTRDTYYANLRRKNGREKPYNVKYWALGNETWGPWQVEQVCFLLQIVDHEF